MDKKNIDWANLGFGYVDTDKRFVANFKDGKWDDGVLTEDSNVVINECAGVLQYAQTIFEGMKAYTTEDGRIVTFRPDLNASRFADSARRLEMPVFPEDKFVEAIKETVKANAAYVPPYGANFIFVTKDNKVVTPKSNSILPSITRRSIMYVAKEYLGLEVEEREVFIDEVKDFAECGLCGTAAVISPVGKIVNHGEEICFPSGMDEMGPITKKLYETLTGIQMGRIEAPEGWLVEIK